MNINQSYFNNEIKILEKKVKYFNNTISDFKIKNSIDELLLKEQLNDILGQFEVCLKYTKVLNRDKSLISAIKYANNMKKHSISLFECTFSTLALFPSNNLYPSDKVVPSDFKIWWNKLPLDCKDFEYQYNCYNQKLLNTDLLESINSIFNIINNSFHKV